MPHALLARSLVFNQLYIHSKSSWVRLKQLVPNQDSYLAGIILACSLLYHTQKNIHFIILRAYWVMIATFQKKSTVTLENLSLSLYLAFMDLLHCCFLWEHIAASIPLPPTWSTQCTYTSSMLHSLLASVLSSFVWEQQQSPHSLYIACSLKLQASWRPCTKFTSNKGSSVSDPCISLTEIL